MRFEPWMLTLGPHGEEKSTVLSSFKLECANYLVRNNKGMPRKTCVCVCACVFAFVFVF